MRELSLGVVVAVSAALTFSGACARDSSNSSSGPSVSSDESEADTTASGQYLPVDEQAIDGEAPPKLSVDGIGEVRPLAVNWSDLGGDYFEPAEVIGWPVVRLSSPVVSIAETRAIPTDVTLVQFDAVDANGIPDESEVEHATCSRLPKKSESGTSGSAGPCSFYTDPSRDGLVVVEISGPRRYSVLAMTWYPRSRLPDLGEVGASWGFEKR